MNQIAINPANTIFAAKRLIGRRFSDCKVQKNMKLWRFKVIEGSSDRPKIIVSYKGQEKEFMAEEISSMILGKMKEMADVYLGKFVKHVVITVPTYFNDSQRQATKDASTIAGLNIIRMIDEPTAAAIAYGLDKKSAMNGKINVLVFDLGGGTFDVSLSTIEEGGIFEVKAVSGDSHLGGEDFNIRMEDHCVDEFRRKWNKDLIGNKRALGRLRFACEKAKRILSSTTKTSIELDCLHEGLDFSIKFTQDKFEELNMSLFDKCIKTLEKCIKDAEIQKSWVDEIILVGGSTRIPVVQRMLREFFDCKNLNQTMNPDEVVAYGAAVLATRLCSNNDKSVRNLCLFDVTPLSLGVQTRGDVFNIVVPRNTPIGPIPTKKSINVTTCADNQSAVCIKVYQGERAKSTVNYLLGQFTISKIPLAPKGIQKIKLWFEIDANGILAVTGEILSTGKIEKLIISHANGRLSKEEIDKMVKDAEIYKLEDQERKKKVVAYNALEDWIYDMKRKIEEYKLEKRVHPENLKKIKNVIADTTKWHKDNQVASVEKIQAMKMTLMAEVEKLKKEKRLSLLGRLFGFKSSVQRLEQI